MTEVAGLPNAARPRLRSCPQGCVDFAKLPMQETDTQTWLDKNFPESAGSNSKGRYNQSAITKAATLDLVNAFVKDEQEKNGGDSQC